MAQDKSSLEAEFQRIRGLAVEGTWSAPEPTGCQLGITTVDTASSVSVDTLFHFVEYVRARLSIELTLVGGGVGCFDMVLSTNAMAANTLEAAIERDSYFQGLLAELNAHTVRIRTRTASKTFAAFYSLKSLFVTNRNRNSTTILNSDLGLIHLFGSIMDKNLHFGMVEALLLDHSYLQQKDGMIKRIWRAVTGTQGGILPGKSKIIIQQIDLLSREQFTALIQEFSGDGYLVAVHGFANDFDDALKTTLDVSFKTKMDRLAILPILFSWPSPGRSSQYLPDTKTAENSELSLQDALNSIVTSAGDKPVNILGHSHGNKILVRAIWAQAITGIKSNFKRFILVEPDVDETFLEQRLMKLLNICKKLTIYHSENDRALAISSFLFDSKRAGQIGMELQSTMTQRVEIIDASKVAQGIMRHAPHVDSPEVINDIHYAIRDTVPKDRFYLSELDAARARWIVNPSKQT